MTQRNLIFTADVQNSNRLQGARTGKADLEFYQTEAIRLDVYAVNRGAPLTFAATDRVVLEAWSGTDTTTLYINKAGSVVNGDGGHIRVELVPAESNLPAGGYSFVVKVLDQTDPDHVVSLAGYVNVVASPNSESVSYVGTSNPYTADEIDYDNTTSGLAAEDVQAAIDELEDEKANSADLGPASALGTDASNGSVIRNDGSIDSASGGDVDNLVSISTGTGGIVKDSGFRVQTNSALLLSGSNVPSGSAVVNRIASDADVAGSAAAVQGNLDDHEGDTDNPHQVTAAQVSAYTTAQADAAFQPLDAALTALASLQYKALLDPDVQGFVSDLADADSRLSLGQLKGLSDLVYYLKRESLWADAAMCPAWRGTVAVNNGGPLPVLGGWVSGVSATKIGDPIFSGNGLMLDGSADGYTIDLTGLQAEDILTVIQSVAPSFASVPNIAANRTFWAFGDTGDDRVIAFQLATGALTGETQSFTLKDGTLNGRLGTNDVSWTAGQRTVFTTEIGPAGTKLWQDGVRATMDLTFNMTATTASGPSETLYTDDDLFFVGCYANNGTPDVFLDGEVHVTLVLKRNLSATQRTAIESLVAAVSNPTPLVWWGDSLTEANHTAGWADAGNTRRLIPPTRHMEALGNFVNVNFGASGETASEIETRQSAATQWHDFVTVIWAGANDEDETDEATVVDEIEAMVANLSGNYVVVTPLVKASWTSTQKANMAAIRTEIISTFPNNYFDAWTVANTTDGTPNAGYRRWQSVNIEDDFHPNDEWYTDFVSDLYDWLNVKGWL